MSRWYIIHAYSGFENKVRDSILSEANRLGLQQMVEAVEVPRAPGALACRAERHFAQPADLAQRRRDLRGRCGVDIERRAAGDTPVR